MNSDFRFMHTSDPHVDTIHHGKLNPATGMNFVFESNLAVLKHLVDEAIERKADIFLLAGDLVSAGNPGPEVYVRLAQILTPLIDAGIPLQMVEGNHERLWLPAKHHSSMNVLSHLLHDVSIEDSCTKLQLVKHDNCNVLVVPYPMKARILSELGKQKVDPTQGDAIVVKHVLDKMNQLAEQRDPDLPFFITGHFTVDGIGLPTFEKGIANIMNECVFPVDALEVLEPDYVALGHIHTPQQVGAKTFYSGSPNKLTFTDANDVKGGNWVTLGGNGSLDVERVLTPVRGMYKFDLAVNSDFDLELEKNDVVQLLLPEGEKNVPSEIEKAAKDAGASLVVKVRPARTVRVNRTVLPEKISPIEALKTYLSNSDYPTDFTEDVVKTAKKLGADS